MKHYTVKDVGRLSGVSIRTLHHYDAVGVLKPASIGENRYRYYGQEELLRLQQILFHREFGLPLSEIAALLDRPDFDRVAALKGHRARLETEAKRYRQLVRTIDRTIAELEGHRVMKNANLYRGFSPEAQARFETSLTDRYGEGVRPHIEAGRARMGAWSEAEKQAHQAEIGAVEAALGDALARGLPADGEAIAPLMRRHHAWVALAWPSPPSAAAYSGLAELYLDHPDFRARYEAIRPGLGEYMAAAMRAFAKRELAA